MNKLPQNNVSTLAGLLRKVEPGFLPYDVFKEVARIVALPIYELVPLRSYQGRIEVLLLERGDEDEFWPNQLHTPGTVIRATDNNGFDDAFKRIVNEELRGLRVAESVFVTNMFHRNERGAEVASVYLVEVVDVPIVGTFYDVNKLPPNVMTSQIDFIQAATELFKKRS